MQNFTKNNITSIILNLLWVTSILISCNANDQEKIFITKEVIKAKNNFDKSLESQNWECFDCMFTDSNNFELFLKKRENPYKTKALLVFNGNGLFSYEKATIIENNGMFQYLSIINDTDTIFNFFSKEPNLFPLSLLEPGVTIDVYSGLGYLESKMFFYNEPLIMTKKKDSLENYYIQISINPKNAL